MTTTFEKREAISMMLLDLYNLAKSGDDKGAQSMMDMIDIAIADLVNEVASAPEGTD